jgi:hypothetical protein
MTCIQRDVNAEFLKKFQEGLKTIVITQCSVCNKIKLGDQLIDYDFFEKYITINNPYKISHAPLTPECLSRGYGIDYMKAKELMRKYK